MIPLFISFFIYLTLSFLILDDYHSIALDLPYLFSSDLYFIQSSTVFYECHAVHLISFEISFNCHLTLIHNSEFHL